MTMNNVLQKITMVPFSTNQYMDEDTNKRQIYIHHTAGSADPFGVVRWWESTPERVATSLIIGGHPGTSTRWKDGDIVQVFSSRKWAWHLGVNRTHLRAGGPTALSHTQLNKESIGIELCNWGQLRQTDRGFLNYVGGRVPDNQVIELSTSYRGFRFYQRYTDAQLENTRDLLRFLGQRWNIPVAYKGDRIFDICPEALRGEPGLYTHTSVRPDKTDCFPQPELIQMLRSL
jgi:N-acetyl-anhydromuramyl-L-alanine amidase AmpD